MVKIRLMRMGKRHQPVYRVVVADSRKPRDGRFIEIIGTYAPLEDPSAISVDEEKALDWLRKGAQPTDQARAILKRAGVWTKHVATNPDKLRPKKGPKRRRKAPPTKPAESAPAAKAPAAVAPAAAAPAPAEPPAEAPAEAPAADAPEADASS